MFRIFKVFYQVKHNATSEERFLGITGETKLRSIIFGIIEIGMTFFLIYLVRLVLVEYLVRVILVCFLPVYYSNTPLVCLSFMLH